MLLRDAFTIAVFGSCRFRLVHPEKRMATARWTMCLLTPLVRRSAKLAISGVAILGPPASTFHDLSEFVRCSTHA